MTQDEIIDSFDREACDCNAQALDAMKRDDWMLATDLVRRADQALNYATIGRAKKFRQEAR